MHWPISITKTFEHAALLLNPAAFLFALECFENDEHQKRYNQYTNSSYQWRLLSRGHTRSFGRPDQTVLKAPDEIRHPHEY